MLVLLNRRTDLDSIWMDDFPEYEDRQFQSHSKIPLPTKSQTTSFALILLCMISGFPFFFCLANYFLLVEMLWTVIKNTDNSGFVLNLRSRKNWREGAQKANLLEPNLQGCFSRLLQACPWDPFTKYLLPPTREIFYSLVSKLLWLHILLRTIKTLNISKFYSSVLNPFPARYLYSLYASLWEYFHISPVKTM